MEGYIVGRSTDEVKEWILERIKLWLEDIDMLEEASDYTQLDMIAGYIENNIMLYQTEAYELERRLQADLQTSLRRTTRSGMHMERINISCVDVLSIYADAWGMYCRPGSYKLKLSI